VFQFDASDRSWRRRFWLTRDYLPEVAAFRVGRPSLTQQPARMEPALIPWACADGFFEAYWRGPRRTSTVMFVAEYRYGPESERPPSRGQCAASVMTSHRVVGPNATASSSRPSVSMPTLTFAGRKLGRNEADAEDRIEVLLDERLNLLLVASGAALSCCALAVEHSKESHRQRKPTSRALCSLSR
jgi:hypothetical protein